RRRTVSWRRQTGGAAAVEWPWQLPQRAGIASSSVSDSGPDDHQHARRRNRGERGAGADGTHGTDRGRRPGNPLSDLQLRDEGKRGKPRRDGLRYSNASRVLVATHADDHDAGGSDGGLMSRSITRLEATRSLISSLNGEPVVASLGHPAYDLFAALDRPE